MKNDSNIGETTAASPTKRVFATGAPHQARIPPGKKPRFEDGLPSLQQPQPRRVPPRRFPPRFPPGPADSLAFLNAFVSGWLESVGVEPDKKRSQSVESFLSRVPTAGHPGHQGPDRPLSRQSSHSAPADMARARKNYVDGCATPPTPSSKQSTPGRSSSDGASSDRASSGTASSPSSSRVSTADAGYRGVLLNNNIHMRPRNLPKPEPVQSLVAVIMSRGRRASSPQPTVEETESYLFSKSGLAVFDGTDEATVAKLYTAKFFAMHAGQDDALETSTRLLMNRQAVPFARTDPVTGDRVAKFSTPAPDLIVGYSSSTYGFPSEQHRRFLGRMDTEFAATATNTPSLVFPFLTVEFKGRAGDLWVAANQCLGASASCVNITEKLNRQLYNYRHDKARDDGDDSDKDEMQTVNSTAFSIAMNGNEARLYVSWRHDDRNYYMSNVQCYLLSRPDHHIEFREAVRNILDWGKNERLAAIRTSLDTLIEEATERTERTERTAAEARARRDASPGTGSSSSASHRDKRPRTSR
ncbi:hypothetical protein SCUCBS95973_009295 [Sporothrix curviconia]|uniref:DUF7924 domain-containing protein n=1 Tax=Sporothrix curviconia TaxID=1260050 RepID=A0ABP0CTR4_9PEZI